MNTELSTEDEELKELLEENIAVAKDTNRLIREMRRNAILGLIAKAVIWLVILGVPLFFLTSYIGPLLDAAAGQPSADSLKPGIFGLPSPEQMNALIEEYRAAYQ